MARIKNWKEAAKITTMGKNKRWDRLQRLFKISVLSELFPVGSTPNGAGDDHLKCSGDVLRDLCLIGQALSDRGLHTVAMRDKVKDSFLPGVPVKHIEIKELLNEIRNAEPPEPLPTQGHTFVAPIVARLPGLATSSLVAPNSLLNEVGAAPPIPGPPLLVNERMKIQHVLQEPEAVRPSTASVSLLPLPLQEQLPCGDNKPLNTVQVKAGRLSEPQSSIASSPFSMLDDSEVSGPRQPKLPAAAGITKPTELEESDRKIDESDCEMEESESEMEYADGSMCSTPTRRVGDGDLIRVYHKGMKRSSAPPTHYHNVKRARTLSTSADYDQSERETLVSCLRMTHALLGGMDQQFDDDDVEGASKQVEVIRVMVEHVLAQYTN